MTPEHHAVFGCLRQRPLFAKELFGAIAPSVKFALDEITTTIRFEENRLVVAAGDYCGIYVLIDGNAKARFFNHLNQRFVIFHILRDEIFGLPETITNSRAKMSLSTVSPCSFNLIDRKGLLNLLSTQPEICYRIIEKFSISLRDAYRTMNTV